MGTDPPRPAGRGGTTSWAAAHATNEAAHTANDSLVWLPASAAETSLPDPVDTKVLDQFCAVYGLSRESLIDRMGGSP